MRADGAPQRQTKEEYAMKLNTAQVARTIDQLQVEALPEDHPLVPQLNRIFGDHEPEVTNTTVALGTDGQGSYGQGS